MKSDHIFLTNVMLLGHNDVIGSCQALESIT